jgi:hypothetical protein
MSIAVEGVFPIEIYATDDGFLAIEQENDVVVLLSADQLGPVIEELRAYYNARVTWQEAKPG